MVRFAVGIVAVVSLLGACATTAPKDSAPAAGKPVAAAKPVAKPATTAKTTTTTKTASTDSKTICRRMSVMGSNYPQKVCHTQAEWAAYDKQGQDTVDQFERAKDQAPEARPPG